MNVDVTKMRQCLLIVVGLLMSVGCQRRSFDQIEPDGELSMVRFRASSVNVEVASKATSNLPAGVTVRVLAFQRATAAVANLANDTCKASCTYVIQSDGSLVPALVNDNGVVIAGTAPEPIELNSGTYDFYAYAPARKLEADNRTVKGIGHYQDFMGVYLGNQTVSRSSSTVALGFEHKCAKITFSARPLAGMTCDSLFVDSVKLRNMGVPVAPASGGYRIGGDIAPTVGGLTDSCVMKKFGYINSAQKGDGAVGSEILLPKNAGTVPSEFYIKVNKTAYLLKATLPSITFSKGSNYVFTVRVSQGSIDLTLNIVSWGDVAQGGNIAGDNGSILIGSWGNVDWSGDVGGNPDNVTAPIVINSWTAVNLPADLGDSNGSFGLNGWGSVGDSGNAGTSGNGGMNTGSWGNSANDLPTLGK